jgi:hypothetical protein
MAHDKLFDSMIKKLKPREKTYKMFDGDGLYLEILPSGSKSWRLKYNFQGKDKRLSFGRYPEIGLADARQHRDKMKIILAKGLDHAKVQKIILTIP